MKRGIKITIISVLAVLVIATIGGSFYMLDYSLTSDANHSAKNKERYEWVFKCNPDLKPWVDSLQHCKALRDTFITMPNGERQHAMFVRAPKKTGRTAVLVHGYKDCCVGMLNIAHIYAQMGYNVLLPDLHGHGLSDGDDIQMGWKDRFDVIHWMAVADKMFRDSTGTTQQVLHGISMGGATTMCVSGEKTPSYVKCFVEDCGYTSVRDEFHYELGEMFGLPDFPLMYTTSLLCKMKYGWSFGEASALNQVKKCHKPMLFIHGDNDDFVPSWMVHPLYAAKPQPKELFIGKGSAHAKTYEDHKVEYITHVKEFVSRYIH
jgi:fermentation-respiration switch protein FrsA (DUF1100 family)